MNPAMLTEIALFAIPVILAVTLHEAAHGFVALHFGDDTAKRAGRLTLNPFNHIDPFGTIVLPLLLILANTGFVFGYAKPVPVNFGVLKNPRWNMIWVAAAGPAMNLTLAVASALLLIEATTLEPETAALVGNMLRFSIQLNLVLAIFNMLPLPPLDGSKVLAAFLPGALARPYLNFGRYGMTVLLLLLVALPLLSARTGFGLDLFGWLVQRPADSLARGLLALTGQT
jgi:Zn-dependent protease